MNQSICLLYINTPKLHCEVHETFHSLPSCPPAPSFSPFTPSPSSLSSLFFSSSNVRYFLRLFFILLAFFFRSRSALMAARLCSPFSNCSTFSARIWRAIFWF